MAHGEAFSREFNGLTRAQDTLPTEYYFDPAHHARELREIWGRNWIYLCRASELPETGDFRLFDIAGQEIVLLRDREGGLRGFHNTCRHRGSALCLEARGKLKGGRLTCPYHQWTYALDGRLVATGAMREVEGFDRKNFSLYGVAVDVWRGFVFANLLGESAPPLMDAIGEETEPLANWPLEGLVVGHRFEKTLECDWKLFWENFNECLHCPNLHPELSELVPIYGRAIMVQRDDPEWRAHDGESDPRFTGRLRDGAESWTMDGAPRGRVFPELTEMERAAGHTYVVSMPSVFIVGHVDYVRSVRIAPAGPGRMTLTAEWLFAPETLADPGFDAEETARFATLVLEQDGGACEMNQRGLRSDQHRAGVLMQEEYEVFAFQEWVRRQLGEAGGSMRPGSRASRRRRDDATESAE